MTQEPTTSRGEQTRQAILDAAEGLILGQGYHGTSMRQIADEAGIAVGGIYNHFAGKEAIFEALLERHQPYSDMATGMSNLSGESVPELVENAARLMIDQALKDPVFVRLGFIDLQEFGGDTIFRLALQMIQGLMIFVGTLVETGEVRDDLPLPVLVRSFAGLVIFYALSEMVGFVDGSPRLDLPFEDGIDWVAGMMDIYMNGVLKKER